MFQLLVKPRRLLSSWGQPISNFQLGCHQPHLELAAAAAAVVVRVHDAAVFGVPISRVNPPPAQFTKKKIKRIEGVD